MFDQIGDLPLHPLAVHAPVVLMPLFALVSVVYAAIARWRRYLGWALVGLAVVTPIVAFVAVQSGKEFERRLNLTNDDDVQQHQNFGDMVLFLSIVLAVVAIALFVIDVLRWRRPADGPGSGGLMLQPVSIVLSVLLAGVAVVGMYYVIRAGHSGAEMVWLT